MKTLRLENILLLYFNLVSLESSFKKQQTLHYKVYKNL